LAARGEIQTAGHRASGGDEPAPWPSRPAIWSPGGTRATPNWL